MKLSIPAIYVSSMVSAVIGTALIGAPIAAAEPGSPLIETTCSYAQVDAALQTEAPQAAERLRNRSQAQSKIQELLALAVPERRERVQGFLDRNPDVRQLIQNRRATPEGQAKMATAQRIADTCHNY